MTAPRPRTIFISAGDISGDQHAAGLIERCDRILPATEWSGLGGEALRAAGCRLLVPPESDPAIGFRRVIGRLPYYIGLLARIQRYLALTRPDLVILVDYPGLNLQIARLASRLGLPVLYFICPQYWAWAPWRVRRFVRLVDKALVIFPFEADYFGSRGVDTTYIGHPLCDRTSAERGNLGDRPADGDRSILALLPGSRKHEVSNNLPVMLATARQLGEHHPRLVPTVAHQRPECLELARQIAGDHRVTIETRQESVYRTARAARLALVASGTATLEVALSGTPLVVVYRVSPMAHRLAPRLLTVPWFCQVNLMAGAEIVPEMLLSDDRPDPLIPICRALLDDRGERRKMIERLAIFRERHEKPGALERAAREVVRMVNVDALSASE